MLSCATNAGSGHVTNEFLLLAVRSTAAVTVTLQLTPLTKERYLKIKSVSHYGLLI